MPTSSIERPYKIYTNWDFWFEKKPSGNTGDDPEIAAAECYLELILRSRVMYNTSVVKNYKATDSIARFHYIFFPD
jgi:hypothetical protein